METEYEYRQRLKKVTDSYCQKKANERRMNNYQELADDIVFTIGVVLFLVIIGSIESIVDFVLSLLCR